MNSLRRLSFALALGALCIVAVPLRAVAPTLSSIPPVTMAEDANSGLLPFTISDVDTDPADVTVTASSSNQALVSDAAIVLSGTGADRAVSFQPVANASGTATITLTASDGVDTGTTTIDVTVNAVNDPPSISDIGPQVTAEGVATPAIPFTIGDIDNGIGMLSVSATSDNLVLVPLANIVLSGAGPNRTVQVTPAAGQNGTATITVTVSDGAAQSSDEFLLTVTGVDSPPTISDIPSQSTAEDMPLGPVAFVVGDPDTAVGTLVVTASADNAVLVPPASITIGGAGANRTISITPAADQHGTAIVTVSVSDGTTTVSDTFDLTVSAVDDPPTISDIGPVTIPEDGSTGPLAFTVGDIDTAPAALVVTASSSNTTLVPNASLVIDGTNPARTITVTPAANQSGTTTITVSVSDGTTAATDTFEVTVTGVDDPPTISDILNQVTDEDVSTGPIPFTVGDADTALGALVVTASSSNPTLVPLAGLGLGGSGAARTITITPAANQGGSATITVTVSDGTTPVSDTFTIDVTPVNDPPTISAIGDQAFDEDGSSGAIPFTVGDAETPAASLVVSASASNTTLFPNGSLVLGGSDASRTIAVTPAPGQSGNAVITVSVTDGENVTSTRTFAVVVSPVDDPPTIDTINPQSTSEDTATDVVVTVGDPDTAPNALTVTATSDNTTLVPNSNLTVSGTGTTRTVTITPAPDRSGTANITVTVSDGTTSVGRTFALTVTPVNDTPTISAIADAQTNEDTVLGPIAFSVGDVETPAGSLSVTASSSNQGVIADGDIVVGGSGASRAVTITPRPNAAGTATVMLTVSDGQATATSAFVVTVIGLNDSPTITAIGPQVTNEDTPTGPIAFTIGDVETAAGSLSVSATSDDQALLPNANIVLGGSGANRTVTVTPAPHASGTANVTVIVGDGEATASRTFSVRVDAVNDLPTFSGVPPTVSMNEDGTFGPIAFTVADADHAPAQVNVTVSSNNATLLPLSALALSGGAGTYALTLTPAANASGSATVTLTATDAASGVTTAPIVVTVNAVNDPPTISNIGDASVNQGTPTPPVVASFTIADIDTSVTCANVAATSSNATLLPNGNLQVSGGGTSCTLTATPVTPLQGSALVTVTVSDGSLSAVDTFTLTVNPPDAPTISNIADRPILEDASTGPIAFTIADADSTLDCNNATSVTAVSSNPLLVPNANLVIGGSGTACTISATPVANGNGTTTITVSVKDNTNLIASDSFLLTVTKVNDTPTLAAITPKTTREDEFIDVPLVLGDVDLGDTPPDTLNVTATSSNTAIVPNANLQVSGGGIARTLRITPAPNQSSTTPFNITVTVTDAASAAAQQAFSLTVNPVNDAPTLSGVPSSLTFNEDTSVAITTIAIGDVDSTVNCSNVSAVSNNTTLIPNAPANLAVSAGSSPCTLTVKSAADAFGTGTVTVRVTDTGAPLPAQTTSIPITVTVTGVNDAPTISAITAKTTPEDTPINVDYTLTDVDSTVTCGTGGSVSVTSSAVNVLPLSGIVLSSQGGANCRLALTPASNASGLTTITITATDGTDQAQRTFTLDVQPVNDAPTMTAIGPQATVKNTPTSPITFTIADVDDDLSGLTLTGASSNTAVVNNVATAFQFGGSQGSRSVVITPVTNATGTTNVTLTVRDAGNAVATRTFGLTVGEGTCTYVVTTQPTTLTFSSTSNTLIVNIATTCPWTVTSNAAWMTMPSAGGPVLVSGGAANGAVIVTLAANSSVTQRQATLTVSGTNFTLPLAITQNGVGCTYSLAPSSQSVALAGGAVGFTLSSVAGCAWSASSSAAWAVVAAPTSGTVGQSGTVSLAVNVAANAGAARSATITVNSATASIQQAGTSNCSYAVSPARLAFGAAGGTSAVSVTATGSCPDGWTATSGAAWATIPPPPTGDKRFGTGAINVTVGDNSGGAPRQATLTIAGQAVIVAQDSPTQGDADGDGLPSAWEAQFGLNATSEAGINGALGDPDGDGVTNLDELRNGTHPRGFPVNTRYLAEGASSAFFETRFALFNPGDTSAIVLMRFQRKGTTPASQYLVIPPKARRTVISTSVPEIANAEFSTLVEADTQVVVDRLLTWGSGRYGSHAETAVVSPRTSWYLAEGATHSNFDLFYLLQNPGTTVATVRVTFLLPVGAPIVRTYTLPANSRDNIWVDQIPGLESTDVSAIIEVTQGPAILVERALYLSPPGGATFVAGHDASAVAAPQVRWFLAEGATGDLFDEFILVANPSNTDADVRATFLLTTGQNIVKTYKVPKNSRFNIWVDVEDPALARAEVSAIVETTNNVPIIVERAMWWPGPTFATWSEAHVSAGTTVTGTQWALAEGEQGGVFNTMTYVLVANTSSRAGTARATLYFEDGSTPVSKDFTLPASSRNNIDIGANFNVAGKRFAVVVESTGSNPVQVVVERAMYSDANGQFWAAGSNAVATKLQ